MNKHIRYVLFFGAVSLIAITASADAGDTIPGNWQPYHPKVLELKPGYKLYQPDGGRRILVDTPNKPQYILVDTRGDEVTRLQMEQTVHLTSACFAEIRTVEQARELCELLIQGGAIVDDAESYQKLLKVHRDFGLKQLVADKELVFEPIAKAVKGGFQIEFTAFHVPQTMGAQSVVARFEFFVDKNATFKIQSSKNYLESMPLNWQTGPLDTAKKREEEGQQLARVDKFLEECYKCCSTRLPRLPEDKKNR